jgi:hypothetical protein
MFVLLRFNELLNEGIAILAEEPFSTHFFVFSKDIALFSVGQHHHLEVVRYLADNAVCLLKERYCSAKV